MQFIKKITFTLILFTTSYFTQFDLLAQTIVKQRSVNGIAGSSNNFSLKGKSFLIQQSIGQSGIIGTSKCNNLILSQGFIQSIFLKKIESEDFELATEISAIPSSDTYLIVFKDGVIQHLDVSLYDLSGKKIYYTNYQNKQEIIIDLSSFSSGIYIISILTKNQFYSSKLFKR